MAAEFTWASERHLRVEFAGDAAQERVWSASRRLGEAKIAGVVDVTPAYATVLVHVRPVGADFAGVERAVREVVERPGSENRATGSMVEIPVCYDGACGLDLEDVARERGLSVEEVVRMHSGAEYVVAFIGFAPGFAYLAGLPAELHTPRLERPRVRVPAGSVAIAGDQAGVYPRATAGGWRIVGRTPVAMFDAGAEPASRLSAGDRVKFVRITAEQFVAMGGGA